MNMSNKIDDAFAFFGFVQPTINTEIKNNKETKTKKTSCNKCLALKTGNSHGIFTCEIFGALETLQVSNLDRIHDLFSKIPLRDIRCKHKPISHGEIASAKQRNIK